MKTYYVEWKPKWDLSGQMRRWKISNESVKEVLERMEHIEPGCKVYRIYVQVYDWRNINGHENEG